MEYEEEARAAFFTVMTVVMLLEAVHGIWALIEGIEGPPECLFADTSNDPSETLDVLQPLCHYRFVLYSSRQQRNSSLECH